MSSVKRRLTSSPRTTDNSGTLSPFPRVATVLLGTGKWRCWNANPCRTVRWLLSAVSVVAVSACGNDSPSSPYPPLVSPVPSPGPVPQPQGSYTVSGFVSEVVGGATVALHDVHVEDSTRRRTGTPRTQAHSTTQTAELGPTATPDGYDLRHSVMDRADGEKEYVNKRDDEATRTRP
jgi:hypothetical protein